MLFVFPFLTLLSMRISSCNHVATNGIILFFLWRSSIPLCIYVPHFFRATGIADRGSQARHQIGAVGAGLYHSSAGSKPFL